MKSAELIARRRKELHLTQGQLAARAGTSRARLNTYERAVVFPTSDTLERILRAMDADLEVTPMMTYEERRSLAISAEVAKKLIVDHDSVVAHARVNLLKMRAAASHEFGWLDTWEAILGLGAHHVASLLTSTDRFARDLRQSSPFAGVLTEGERSAAIAGIHR